MGLSEVLFVRHGETDGNKNGIVQSPSTELNDVGKYQAKCVASRIGQEYSVHKIISSDFKRAKDTAAAISEEVQVPMVLSPLLRERSFGDLIGKKYSWIKKQRINIFDLEYMPPQGESNQMLENRVVDAWKLICDEAERTPKGQVLVVVTHGLVLSSIAKLFLGVEQNLKAVPFIHFFNTSISHVEISSSDGNSKILDEVFNCDKHLRSRIRQTNTAKF